MLRLFLAALATAWCFSASAQVSTPFIPSDQSSQREAVSNSSGNVAAATATATLPAAQSKTTALCGVLIASSGATAAVVVNVTVTGVVGGTWTFPYEAVAGVTLADQTVVIPITPCMPATAQNATIVVSMPSLGAGNTNSSVTAWGYRY